MISNWSRSFIAVVMLGCTWGLSGCGGGGSGSSVNPTPTLTPTPRPTPDPLAFTLEAVFTEVTDPEVPTAFVTMKGRGRIFNSSVPASFNASFFSGDVNQRVLSMAVNSPKLFRVGDTFAVTPARNRVPIVYSDTDNQRFFVAQSGTIRIDRLATNSVTGVTSMRFSVTNVRMVPDTTVPVNYAVGSFMLHASGWFPSQAG